MKIYIDEAMLSELNIDDSLCEICLERERKETFSSNNGNIQVIADVCMECLRMGVLSPNDYFDIVEDRIVDYYNAEIILLIANVKAIEANLDSMQNDLQE